MDVDEFDSRRAEDLVGQVVVNVLVRNGTIYAEFGNTFDLNEDQKVIGYSVLQSNGRPLPDWAYQVSEGLLLLETPVEGGVLEFNLTAHHKDGTATTRTVVLQLETGEVQQGQTSRTANPATFEQQLQGQH